MKNLNLIFNKLYYSKLGGTEKDFKDNVALYNKIISNTVFDHKRDYTELGTECDKFLMKTKYPGMLIGIGYPHGTLKADDDISAGFSFDYVTGQPYIPGSTVKGVLKSHFTKHSDALKQIMAQLFGSSEVDVDALSEEIFDSGDVFFDAVIYSGNASGKIVSMENITPHGDAIKSPNVLKILKVLPDVKFEFRFALKNGTLTAEQKMKLFKTLLCLFGVGAKTNVGYGYLEETDDTFTAPQQHNTQTQNTNRSNNQGNRKPKDSKAAVLSDKPDWCPKCKRYVGNLPGKVCKFCK